MSTSSQAILQRRKDLIIEILCSAYVLLFVYASFSKLLDFDNFHLQINRSPFTQNISWWPEVSGAFAWGIPASEIAIAVGLMMPAVRFRALVLTAILMVFFT